MTLFSMFGAMMCISKYLTEFLPNVHLLGMFTVLFTVVYRRKALIPIYVFVFLMGLTAGFNMWWVPYLYIWTVLWAMAMLIPKNLPKWAAIIIYPVVCSLHGFMYGTLYSPFQAFAFGLDFDGMIAWIVAGFPWDIIHGVSNFAAGLLIFPLSEVLKKIHNHTH